jgi:hypothetical protein
MNAPLAPPLVLRSPDEVMRLERLGAAHPTRLSFLRAMLRRVEREKWAFSIPVWSLDAQGFGHAVLAVDTPERRYALVCFSTPLADEDRTDRVIATAWDTSYVLYDGMPDEAEIERLSRNAPRQEAGRYGPRDLILSRANKSVRLFAHVVERLASGLQPDPALIESVGYLMRTTAVYGNGKFGIADRDVLAQRDELSGPFRAEMLSVWLTRAFTVRLAEHIARHRAPGRAVALDAATRQVLGVGNATGLGMAPFLVHHPRLVHAWFNARETALARVRAMPNAKSEQQAAFMDALAAMRETVRRWRTDDAVQAPRVARLAEELALLAADATRLLTAPRPWDALYRHAATHFSLEGQEAVVALALEPHGSVIDDLAETMGADEDAERAIDGVWLCRDMAIRLRDTYRWVDRFDFARAQEQARFWYVSEEKLEPRLGFRDTDEGAGLEQPLAVARDMAALITALEQAPAHQTLGEFLARAPEWRHAARRAFIALRYPYSEVRDNLIGADVRPVDLLRSKLAFFGAARFDPRSDLWLRISLFAGYPDPQDICRPAFGEATA